MVPVPVSSKPSASRTLTGGSVVFMALPSARVRARAASSRTLPHCIVQGTGSHFKAIDSGGCEADRVS